jgi:hypothetical protein
MSNDQQKPDQTLQDVAENTTAESGVGTSNPPAPAGSANTNTDGAVNNGLDGNTTNERESPPSTAPAEHANSDAGDTSTDGAVNDGIAHGNQDSTGGFEPEYSELFGNS